jgi:hypothetical protein
VSNIFYFFAAVFLLPCFLNAQIRVWNEDSAKQNKQERQLYMDINFPGFGFSHYEMESSNILYFDKNLQKDAAVEGPFIGNAINVFYGLSLMLPVKRYLIGINISQQYIHIMKFYNKSIGAYAEPLFASYEQVHFQKLGARIEYIVRKKQFSSLAIRLNANYVFPDKVYIQKYVKDRIDVGAGLLFCCFLSNRTQFIFSPFFEYTGFSNQVRQDVTDAGRISFNQTNPDRILSNKIYSFNCNIGLRFNLFKVKGLKIRSPRYAE